VSPDVAKRKIALITQYLDDLARYRGLSFEEHLKNRYAIERILELVIMTAADLVFHLLAHGYESIDHRLVHQSVEQTLLDFLEFTRQIAKTVEA
jgi:uncharacterized protein YutE (UPF0331/DUF86 family)